MNTINKQVWIKAPVSRVWKALTDAREFGQWFGAKLDGPFEVGRTMRGTFDDLTDEEWQQRIDAAAPQVGLAQHAVKAPQPADVFCVVHAIQPETYFAFRWTPYAIDASADPLKEPMTLCEFRLEPKDGGTQLHITESGFDAIPAERRERAFKMNDGGWAAQADNIKTHVEK